MAVAALALLAAWGASASSPCPPQRLTVTDMEGMGVWHVSGVRGKIDSKEIFELRAFVRCVRAGGRTPDRPAARALLDSCRSRAGGGALPAHARRHPRRLKKSPQGRLQLYGLAWLAYVDRFSGYQPELRCLEGNTLARVRRH